MKPTLTVLFALLVGVLCSRAELPPEVSSAIETWLKEGDPVQADDWPVYQRTLMLLEELEPVVSALEKELTPAKRWLCAKLQWRYGQVEDALKHFEVLAESSNHPMAAYRVAQLYDAQGDVKEAAIG